MYHCHRCANLTSVYLMWIDIHIYIYPLISKVAGGQPCHVPCSIATSKLDKREIMAKHMNINFCFKSWADMIYIDLYSFHGHTPKIKLIFSRRSRAYGTQLNKKSKCYMTKNHQTSSYGSFQKVMATPLHHPVVMDVMDDHDLAKSFTVMATI